MHGSGVSLLLAAFAALAFTVTARAEHRQLPVVRVHTETGVLAKPGEELRVAHEPTTGDYMCQVKLILTATDKGTNVAMWDQYTDESSPPDLAATADKMERELGATLAGLKRDCETHHSLMPTLHIKK